MAMYSCLPENIKPDWHYYIRMYAVPQKNVSGSTDETEYVGCKPADAEIWSVFADYDTGDCDLLADFDTEQEAKDQLRKWSEQHPVPVVHPYD